MFWYTRELKNCPLNQLIALKRKEEAGLVSFDVNKKADRKTVELAREMQSWTMAAGKFLFEPNPKEQRYFLQPHRVRGISGGNRPLCVNTMVKMADGLPKILSEIVVGDQVMSLDPDGRLSPATVTGFHDVGFGDCYKITTKCGSWVEASTDHPFPVQVGGLRSRAQRLTTSEICDFVLDGAHFVNINSHRKPGKEIVAAIPVGKKKLACITIDNPSHIFVLANDIPTYNSGKTATLVIDDVMEAEGWHPLQKHNLEKLIDEALADWVKRQCEYVLENKLWIKAPPVRMRLVSVDYPNYIDKVIGPEYEKWLTKADAKNINYDNDKKRRITWKNGSSVEFMTFEQPVKAHGGSARHKITFDEEPPPGHWKENMMRIISTKGRIQLGMTSVNGVTWTEDEVWKPGLTQKDPKIWAMEMTTYDNPMNTPEVVDEIKAMCGSPVEIDIRIYGKRTARGGRVYPMSKNESPWIISPFEIPDHGLLLCMIDPHPHIPHAVLWQWADFKGEHHPAIDEKPNIYNVAELFKEGDIPTLANHIRGIEQKLGRYHDVCIADPAAWVNDQTKESSRSVADLLDDMGIYPVRGSKQLVGGILKVQEMLSLNWVEKMEEGNWDVPKLREFPRLMTFSTLERTIWERENYRFKAAPMNLKEPRDMKPRPVDKDDHMMECERRGCEFIYDEQYELSEPQEKLFNPFQQQGIDVVFESPEDEEYSAISDPLQG